MESADVLRWNCGTAEATPCLQLVALQDWASFSFPVFTGSCDSE